MKKQCICCGEEMEIKRGGMLICAACYTKLLPTVLKKRENKTCPVCGMEKPGKKTYCCDTCKHIGQVILKRWRHAKNEKKQNTRELVKKAHKKAMMKHYRHTCLPPSGDRKEEPVMYYGKNRTKLDDDALAAKEAGMTYGEWMYFKRRHNLE